MRHRLFAFFLTVAAACSCTREIETVPIYELGCPQSILAAESDSGSVRFIIYSNGAFTGTVKDDWMEAARFRGQKTFSLTGDCTIDVAYTHNYDSTRVGTVELALGNRTVALQIVQKGDKTVEKGVEAVCVGASSSSLCFEFAQGETDEEQCAYPYRVALFSDADTTDLVVSHRFEGGTSIWNKTTPRFTFAGLESDTVYYFVAYNTATGKKSEILCATTLQFTPVEAGSASAQEGSVIFAEDFSQIPWNGDEIYSGAGFRALNTSLFISPAGECPEGQFGGKSFECPLFDIGTGGFGDAVKESRLSLWSASGEDGAPENRMKVVFARSGYLKLGGYSWCSSIVTPALDVIPKGKVAKVRVDFTASRYSTDSENAVVSVAKGSVKDFVFTPSSRTDKQFDLATKVGWNSYSFEFDEVTSDSRIMIGPDCSKAGTGQGLLQHRLFLDDCSVTLLSLSDDVKPTDVTVDGILFTEAAVNWTAPQSAECCKVYLDGSLAATLNDGERSYSLEGLSQGTQYSVVVSAVSGGVEKVADPVSFTTKDVRIVETSPTSVCVEWDDLSEPTLWSGQDRAYEMALYADSECTQELVCLYPFDGVKTDYFAFNDGRTSSTSTTYWNGIVNGVPRLTKARVSIGCLQPQTTYWFRVRSRAVISVTGSKGTYTLTNSAGDSGWSSPVEVTTSPVHTPVLGEVIFQGFDLYSVQRDLHNQCPGIQPRMSEADRALFEGTDLPYEDGFGLNTFGGMGDSYNVSKWGWFKGLDGEEEDYFTGAVFNGQKNLVDKDGWHYGGDIFPEMGYMHVSSTKNYYIGTPALTENLSEEPSTCTLTFDGFAYNASYSTSASKALKLKVVHSDGTIEDLSCPSIPYSYENESPGKDNFVYSTAFVTLSTDLELKKGDAVLIVNPASNRFMIDNILIFKK